MNSADIEPLAEIAVSPYLAALPKADLHVHAETDARLDRVLAHQAGRRPYDWRSWAQRMQEEVSPGMARLAQMDANRRVDAALVDTLDADPSFWYCQVRGTDG